MRSVRKTPFLAAYTFDLVTEPAKQSTGWSSSIVSSGRNVCRRHRLRAMQPTRRVVLASTTLQHKLIAPHMPSLLQRRQSDGTGRALPCNELYRWRCSDAPRSLHAGPRPRTGRHGKDDREQDVTFKKAPMGIRHDSRQRSSPLSTALGARRHVTSALVYFVVCIWPLKRPLTLCRAFGSHILVLLSPDKRY